MLVRVPRKFEHGLLFSYDSRIDHRGAGGGGGRGRGSTGDSSDRSADVLEYNSNLKC